VLMKIQQNTLGVPYKAGDFLTNKGLAWTLEMHTEFWWEKMRQGNGFEDTVVGVKVILNWILTNTAPPPNVAKPQSTYL
jgi:hypothetical protein